MNPSIRPLNYDNLRNLLAPRPRDSHKGCFGHTLVLGGSPGFGGAVLMAAEAAARCGSGLTSVVTHPDHAALLLPRRPEIMICGSNHTDVINAMMQRSTVLVAGPGLGKTEWSIHLLQKAMNHAAEHNLPVVLDADGLNLLAAQQLVTSVAHKSKWILTPHTGEAARLLGCDIMQIESDRDAAVRQLQQKFGASIVLKGPGTLIGYQQQGRQQVESCVHGNPGMASGGMGDVLSGIIGGLLAQGLSVEDSARLGVCLHSKAADMAAAEHGERGLLACDLFPYLRTLLNP